MIGWIFAATGLTALISLSGVIFFSRFEKIKQHINGLISLSVGVFLGVIFIDLIPEALTLVPKAAPFYILGGFLGFILISHLVSVFHHHHGEELCEHCDPAHHRTALLILLGDLAHNFVDGVVIAAAFLVNPAAGIGVTAGVLLHEIPQEIAEFFVLIRAGYSRTRALFLNFLVSLSVVLGAIIAFFFATHVEGAVGPILGIAAGNLLYIAAADLLPHIFPHDVEGTQDRGEFLQQFLLLLLGTALVIGMLQAGKNLHSHTELSQDHTETTTSTKTRLH